MAGSRIYLDHAATTPVLPEALEAMVEALGRWHNPSSPHAEGRAAKAEVERARERIASALGWSGRVIFTSGATESLAIALQRAVGGRRCISAVEHEAVRRAAPDAEELAVDPDGTVTLTDLGERAVVAIQHANNETGVLQPIDRLAAEVRARGGVLVADCAQTAGKIPLPDADIVALSAHKFGGVPGVGALLVRDLAMLTPVGGQEQGYRAGTENLPAIVAMAAALEAGTDWMRGAADLRARLDATVAASGGEVVAAGSERIPTIASYRMPGIGSDTQLVAFDMAGVAVSAGSACSSGSLKASRVLAAMGWAEDAAREVVRVSFGRATTAEQVDRFAALWKSIASRRRAA